MMVLFKIILYVVLGVAVLVILFFCYLYIVMKLIDLGFKAREDEARELLYKHNNESKCK